MLRIRQHRRDAVAQRRNPAGTPGKEHCVHLGNTSPERLESVADDTVISRRSQTPVQRENKALEVSPAKSISSVSSFPSLSEICLTASTQGTQTTSSQGAIDLAMKARKSDVSHDLEYEEAMRQLDERDGSSDSDVRPPKMRIKKSLDTARRLLEIMGDVGLSSLHSKINGPLG